MTTSELIQLVENTHPYSRSDVIKNFVKDHDDPTVLRTITELTTRAREFRSLFCANLASMLKQCTGLQIGPPTAFVRQITPQPPC